MPEFACQLPKHTNSDHQDLSRPDHVYHPVRVLEDLNHHFGFIRRRWLPLGVRARMHDRVHIQIQIVHFLPVRVGLGGIHGYFLAIDLLRSFFDDWGDDLRVLGG